MASVNSTSSKSALLGVQGKGIGGLATGLNTDELVSALTAGTQSKIAKQGQAKQLLNWKMTGYRSMASALTAFQQKFLKISSSTSSSVTNITSNSFFNTFKATSSSSKVTATASSSSKAGNFTINSVSRLAEAESFTGLNKVSTTLGMDFSAMKDSDGNIATYSFSGQTLKLDVDGFATKTIKLDDLNAAIKDGAIDTAAFKSTLQGLINKAFNSDNIVQVDVKDGQVILDSKSAKIRVNTKNDMLGLAVGDSNRVNTDTKIGDLDAFKNVQGDVLTFKINGVEISVNKNDTISTLTSRVTNSGADVIMEYDKYNDVFKLTSKKMGADSTIEMSDVHGNLMSEIFGAKSGNGIGTNILTTTDTISFNNINQIDSMTDAERKTLGEKLKGMSFDLTVNGVKKTVKLDVLLGIDSTKLVKGTYTSDDVYNAINKGIQNSFYNSGVEFGKTSDGRTLISSSKDEAFDVTAKGDIAKLLGMSDGSSVTAGNIVYDYGYDKTIASNDGFIKAEDLGLNAEHPSKTFSMTINGVYKEVTIALDKREEGDTTNGGYYALTNDNLVSKLNAAVKEAFGAETAKLVSFSGEYEKEPIERKYLNTDLYVKESDGYYKKGEDGLKTGDKLFDLPQDGEEAGYYKDGVRVADEQGYALDKDGKRVVMGQQNVGVKLTLNVADGLGKVTETAVSMFNSGVENDIFNKLGFGDASVNNLNKETGYKLSQLNGGSGLGSGTLTINNMTFNYDENTTIQDLLADLNRYDDKPIVAGIKNGKLFINSTDDTISIQDSGKLLESIFGITGGSFETKAATYQPATFDEDGNQIGGTHKSGINALLNIDGVDMEWSSNNYNYNGVNITLNEISTEKIQIGVQSDPDDVVKRIKEWMDDYNALVYTLNSAVNEGKNREYTPLTDEQKAEMSDDQIKTWETEAKKGVLQNDQTLRGILADMRGVFYEKVAAAGISLYDIGIVTKSGLSDPNEAGQLQFDTNITGGGEDRLRNMLINDPDKVRMLFTDAESGIGNKLNSIITRAANTSSVDRGTLVRIAGTEKTTGDNTSQIGNKISAIDKYIISLKNRLETEYNRYWKQFSSLETSVQKMNMQSSWLQSQ